MTSRLGPSGVDGDSSCMGGKSDRTSLARMLGGRLSFPQFTAYGGSKSGTAGGCGRAGGGGIFMEDVLLRPHILRSGDCASLAPKTATPS